MQNSCVIHDNTVIEDDVKIYQNVTIGRGDIYKEQSDDFDGFLICKGAVICSGARIISSHGKLVIGANSIIGANCVLLNSVPDNSVVVGIPGRIIMSKNGKQ